MWWLLLPLVVATALAVKFWRRHCRRRGERVRRDHIRELMAAQAPLWAVHLGINKQAQHHVPMSDRCTAPLNVSAYPPTRAHGVVGLSFSPSGDPTTLRRSIRVA